jgi:hypothetical protein
LDRFWYACLKTIGHFLCLICNFFNTFVYTFVYAFLVKFMIQKIATTSEYMLTDLVICFLIQALHHWCIRFVQICLRKHHKHIQKKWIMFTNQNHPKHQHKHITINTYKKWMMCTKQSHPAPLSSW